MNVALTNYGVRYTTELLKQDGLSRIDHDAGCRLLLELWAATLVPYWDHAVYNRLRAQGFIEQIPETRGKEEVALRYRRNPLEHVKKVIFEYTTHCCIAKAFSDRLLH